MIKTHIKSEAAIGKLTPTVLGLPTFLLGAFAHGLTYGNVIPIM